MILYFLEISAWRDFISRPRFVQRQFKCGVYRDQYARAYTASIISLFVWTYNTRARILYCCRLSTMWRDFEGGVYWDELAETCSEVFEEIRYWLKELVGI